MAGTRGKSRLPGGAGGGYRDESRLRSAGQAEIKGFENCPFQAGDGWRKEGHCFSKGHFIKLSQKQRRKITPRISVNPCSS